MRARVRKLIGVTGTVVFLIVYCLLAMAVGAHYFADADGWVRAAYYVVAGLAWLPIPMALVVWMQNPRSDIRRP